VNVSLDERVRQRLKDAGVSDRVLAAMERRGMTARPTAENKDAGPIMVWVQREFGHVSSPLTFTVFVNGTPLTSFLGEERQIVITSLLKEGKNDFRVVSSRTKDAMEDNDFKAQVVGPLRYNARRERFEGKPVAQFNAMQGWERERQSGQLVAKADRQADSIERNVPFMLDEAPSVARRPAAPGSRQ